MEQSRNDYRTFPTKESGQCITSIDAALNRLHFLASAIRKASAQGPEQGQFSFLNENDKLFHNVAVAYVKRECPDARPSLREHMADFIAERRRAILQRNRHAKKLKTRRKPNVPPSLKTESSKKLTNMKTPTNIPTQATDFRTMPSESGSKATQASKMDGRLAHRHINQRPTISMRSSGSSRQRATESVIYPDPPKIGRGDKFVQCPYCLEPLLVAEMRKLAENEYWR